MSSIPTTSAIADAPQSGRAVLEALRFATGLVEARGRVPAETVAARRERRVSLMWNWRKWSGMTRSTRSRTT